MTTAQIAWTTLTGVLVAAAVVLICAPTGNDTMGYISFGFALFGWLVLLAMITSDQNARAE